MLAKLVLTTDYTVQGAGVFTGGTVTLGAGNLPTGTRVFIASDPLEVQLTLFAQNAPTDPAATMAALDLLTREVQALKRRSNNSIQIPVAESLDGYDMVLPAAVDRESTIVGFNASGVLTPVSAGGLVPTNATVTTVTDESVDLPQSRRLTGGDGVLFTDGGAGSTLGITAPGIALHFNAIGNAPALIYEVDPDSNFASARVLTEGSGISITQDGPGQRTIISATGGAPPNGGAAGSLQGGQGVITSDWWQTPQELILGNAGSTGAAPESSYAGIPFFAPVARVISGFGVCNGSAKAGKVLRVALYRAISTSDIWPGAKLVEADIPLDSTGWASVAAVATLEAGYVYWMVMQSNATSTSFNCNNTSSWWLPLGIASGDPGNSCPNYVGLRITAAFDTLPDPFPVDATARKEHGGVGDVTTMPSVAIRFSA